MLFVLFGPGGAGKGTIAGRLVDADDGLWLSRSWTTRSPRPGESEDAYVFVDRPAFERRVESGGFFEWAEFLGNLYGTPIPEPVAGCDVLLEIDLQGAQQVRRRRSDAVLILLRAPSLAVQEERMRERGDDADHIAKRLLSGADEERIGLEIADDVVVNHEVTQATADVAGIVERYRSVARQGGRTV